MVLLSHFLTERLTSATAFEEQLDRLHEKYVAGGLAYAIEQDGVSLAAMAQDAGRFSRALVKDIRAGRYALEPAQLRMITVGEKERLIYKFRLTDLLVHGVVSAALHDWFLPRFSPRLYSYIKGRDWWDALRDFSAFVRAHFRSKADKRSLGLYVLRRDIAKYTDSIPVGDSSPLWPLLLRETGFPAKPEGVDRIAWDLCRGVIRTEAFTLDGAGHFTNLVGVPTGSPISTTLFNVYIVELDRKLDALEPGFYARYGDDLLFADIDPEKARRADEIIRTTLKEHRLRSNVDKSRNLFFNGAGRPSSAWPAAKGSPSVEFLGCRISADATVALGPKNHRLLIADLEDRLRRLTANLPRNAPPAERGPLVCRILNEALDPESALAQKSAAALRYSVTDREYLKELDREILKMALKWISGSRSVKAFREFSPARLRRQWKLISLYHARNMQGKKR
jgi:hypothetical protein